MTTPGTATRRQRIAVLYGGKSGEHDVSIMSASSVMEQLDDTKYEVTPVFISRAGSWAIPLDQLKTFDCVFPLLHGPNGEDGSVQGLLTALGVPFVGAGVAGSAVGMDKVIFKDVMRAHDLPCVPHVVVRAAEWKTTPNTVTARVLDKLGLPVFVKPANMGSSVGITKVSSADDLAAAVAEAFKWDYKVLVEWAVPNARELEVSVLGNDEKIASAVGEIKPKREFYTYAAKYLDKGAEASELIIPAPIPDALVVLIQETAIEVAILAEARGMARVDLLMNGATGEIYINEINTIPGFTEISMYPKLFAASGLAYPSLLDKLIELAYESATPPQN